MHRFGKSTLTGYVAQNVNGAVIENRPADHGFERSILAQVAGGSTRHEGIRVPRARRLAPEHEQMAWERARRAAARAGRNKGNSEELSSPKGRAKKKQAPALDAPAGVERIKSAKRK